MYVHSVQVRNFRGIGELDWHVGGRLVCLVGQNDSTKTTALDAIEFALCPRWSLLFTEADFHGGRSDRGEITIRVTVGDIPDDSPLLDEVSRFGLYVRGVKEDERKVSDELESGYFKALTVQLKVDSSCEPEWTVIAARDPEGRRISWRDRQSLGVARLEGDADQDLSWSRQSNLTKLAGGEADIEGVLADAQRRLKDAVEKGDIGRLNQAAKEAEEAARKLGVSPLQGYKPGLDPRHVSFRSGSFALHDGDIPLRAAGMGTRRLVALAVQRASVRHGAVVLADEIDLGLEPHRVRRLLRNLRDNLDSPATGDRVPLGQVIMTTHSAIPLLELKWQDIRVVRSNGGRTEILSPGPDATEITKRVPSAFFARKVMVCEGPTEVGLIRNIEDRWAQDHEGRPLAHEGVEVVNGEGSNAPARAKALAALKYRVAFFGDSDKLRPTVKQDMLDSEITVIVWNGKASTEQRLARDLPVSGLRELIALGTELRCLESIRDSMAARLELIEKKAEVADPADLSAWLRLGANGERVREAVGLAAKEKEWFKTIEWGQRLGRLLEKHLPDMPDTDLAQKLRTLESWCYGG